MWCFHQVYRLSTLPAASKLFPYVLQNLENVVGDIVVAAGAIAYSGPFTPAFRQSLQQEWTAVLQQASVPHTADTNLIDTLQVIYPSIIQLPVQHLCLYCFL